MRFAFAPYLLHFKEPGGTSRGVMTEKPTFLVKIFDEQDPEHFGIGRLPFSPVCRRRQTEITCGNSRNSLPT